MKSWPISIFGYVLAAGAFGWLPGIHAQTPAAPKQKFEVASIRRCDPGTAARGGRGNREGGPGTWSPGRITFRCVTAQTLLQYAYIRFADGKTEPTMALRLHPIQGAPAWVSSELYSVEAKAAANSNRLIMFGPMLQSLLEDRFGLKLHYETKIVPTWDLTLAKGRPKLRPTVEVAGKCTLDLPPGMKSKGPDGLPYPGFSPDGHLILPSPPPGQPCHTFMTLRHGPNSFFIGKAITLDTLSSYLVRSTDRPVTDKTGLTGKFDIVFEFAPDDAVPDSSGASPSRVVSDVPTLGTALEEQLGLKLVGAKGPRDFIVVDKIDRPSDN